MSDKCRIYNLPDGSEIRVRGGKPLSTRGMQALVAILYDAYRFVKDVDGNEQLRKIQRVREAIHRRKKHGT